MQWWLHIKLISNRQNTSATIWIIIHQSYAKLPVHSSSPRCSQWVPALLNTVPSSTFYWIPNGESLNFWLQIVYSFLDICKAALTKAFPQKTVNRKWKPEIVFMCLCMYVIMRWCAHTMMWLKMESVEQLHKYKAKMIFFFKEMESAITNHMGNKHRFFFSVNTN